MNVNQIRRNVRNVVHNYTDAQVKVREATSNDPWGPSSTLMSQIAEYTHNMVAFTDVMQMVWRRLNDHGKNWRHVYKSLVLLEYLIKVGNDRVSQQCRENIFSIETLKDFQHMEENVDHGRSVREKSKQLVLLLQDEERLKSERVRALKAHQRFLESGVGFAGTDTSSPVSPTDEERSVDVADGSTNRHSPPQSASDVEMARPLTAGEEQLQLQLAIAISQEEAEKDRQRDRNDELRLQMAIRESASTQDFPAASSSTAAPAPRNGLAAPATSPLNSAAGCAGGDTGSSLQDLLGLDSSPGGDPWAPIKSGTAAQTDPWGGGNRHVTSSVTSSDPWTPHSATPNTTAAHKTSCNIDPWSPQQTATTTTGSNNSIDEFTELTLRSTTATDNNTADNSNKGGNSPWDVTVLATALTPTPANGGGAATSTGSRSSGVRSAGSRSPHDFLGENVALVNLDNLIGPVNLPAAQLPPTQPANPFGWATSVGSGAAASIAVTSGAPNPFLAQQPAAPSINQIRDRKFGDSASGNVSNNPWDTEPSAANPFLS